MDNSHYIGIDISCKTFDVAIFITKDNYKHKQFDNNPQGFAQLLKWINKPHDSLHILMEATNTYWEDLAYFLSDNQIKVSVVNPKRTKGYANSLNLRNKTDVVDAKLLARFCAKEQPDLWLPPSDTDRGLLLKLRQLEHLKCAKQAEQTRLTMLKDADAKASCQRMIDFLSDEIKVVNQLIDALVASDKTLANNAKLLATIPSVGKSTIPWLLAYLRDGSRFDKSKQATSFAGLTPMQHQFGSSVNTKPRISKIGHSEIRKVLFMPALVAGFNERCKCRPFLPFVNRLLANGKPKPVIITALMRKILAVAQAVLKSQLPFDASFHQFA